MKIGACIMVHNMAPFIKAVIHSLSWVDGIYLFDDNSNDGSAELAVSSVDKIPIIVEKSTDSRLAFERGELEVRNHILDNAFKKLECDVLISVDSDELLSENLRPEIEKMWKDKKYNSICFTIWHLYNKKEYLHFWETKINGVYMIDPHTRVIMQGRHFGKLFEDGSHPIIHATEKTLCLHGPYHFHLKYFSKSPYPNYALNFLPKRITYKAIKPYLRELPFTLPVDIQKSLNLVEWNKLKIKETKYYDAYTSERIKFSDPKMALQHPKDKE